jgi:hypothetical protein
MALQAGSRLGPYEVLSVIGVGGMGEVYCACDTRLDWSFERRISTRSRSPEYGGSTHGSPLWVDTAGQWHGSRITTVPGGRTVRRPAVKRAVKKRVVIAAA